MSEEAIKILSELELEINQDLNGSVECENEARGSLRKMRYAGQIEAYKNVLARVDDILHKGS